MKAKKRTNRPDKPGRRKLPSAKAKGPGSRRNESLPAYSEDGIDLTLIRWMLSLTPAKRLEGLQNNTLREKIRQSRRALREKIRRKTRFVEKSQDKIKKGELRMKHG